LCVPSALCLPIKDSAIAPRLLSQVAVSFTAGLAIFAAKSWQNLNFCGGSLAKFWQLVAS